VRLLAAGLLASLISAACETKDTRGTASREAPDRASGVASAELRARRSAQQNALRQELLTVLGIPGSRVPLAAEKRGESDHDGIVIERWLFTSEPGSRVPAVLYRPTEPVGPMPALVLTFGHGASKSHWSYDYAAQLYARLGLAVLSLDPIGEEERDERGRTGARTHDEPSLDRRARVLGRPILGKLVFDTMRGVDLLFARGDVDHDRIGVAGNSLGGAVAAWMAALDTRLRLALVSGWAFDDGLLTSGKACTQLPQQRMRELCSWSEYAALSAPHAALLIMNGASDSIIDDKRDGSAWAATRAAIAEASAAHVELGSALGSETWLELGGGHRPYFAHKVALRWIQRYLGTPGWTSERIEALPEVNAGRWCDAHGVRLEKLYATDLNERGASLVDLGLSPTPRSALTCLNPGELGAPELTLEGWLDGLARD
jgi:dienelactone hydrolase